MKIVVKGVMTVEDALASLLDDADPLVQRRALATYVRVCMCVCVADKLEVTCLGSLPAYLPGDSRHPC